jgi:hypothetical protein
MPTKKNAKEDIADFKEIIRAKIASGEILDVAASMDLVSLKQLIASLAKLCEEKERQ